LFLIKQATLQMNSGRPIPKSDTQRWAQISI
jgi:hypothetical protein